VVNFYIDMNKESNKQIEEKDSIDFKFEYDSNKQDLGKHRIIPTEESKDIEQASSRSYVSDNTIQIKDNKF